MVTATDSIATILSCVNGIKLYPLGDSQVALVTGGSHGIGREVATQLALAGCNIAVCARGKERLFAFVDYLRAGGCDAIGIEADVTIPENVDKVIEQVISRWGTVHILVNNVGGGGRWGKENPLESDDLVWGEVYNKNAMTAIRFTMRVLPHMLKQKWGRVVTIASIFGREGGGRPWFNMAKAAEISLMKTLSQNPLFARNGITFNSVAPGAIYIEGTGWEQERRTNPEGFKAFCESLPMGRLGTPEEVANVVSFLCRHKASWVNGACIAVDGGQGVSF